MADAINLLSQNQRLVIEANDPESSSAKYLRQFENKFEFRLFTQWTDNYVCDHVSPDFGNLEFIISFLAANAYAFFNAKTAK